MPARLSVRRRVATAARWPVGVTLTSWRYMWRTTPMHRSETAGELPADGVPPLPAGVARAEVQPAREGVGPLYHRLYVARIAGSELAAVGLMHRLRANPDAASPSEFAAFIKLGGEGPMQIGDEYVVRMAGPWDGPVRVIDTSPASFRFVTLDGHLEAGQIEFSARDLTTGHVELRIESWARSASRLVNVLYTHMRMAKEVQVHMWVSFLEGAARIAGGRLEGGIELETRCVADEHLAA